MKRLPDAVWQRILTNVSWILIGFGIVLLVAIFMIPTSNSKEITWNDFPDIIEAEKNNYQGYDKELYEFEEDILFFYDLMD